MRLTRKAVFIGLASLAMAGAACAADAPRLHTLNIALPDGSVEQIRYSGDRPPVVVLRDAPAPQALAPLAWFDGFDPASFAMLDRIAADLDRSEAAMMRRIGLARPGANGMPGLDLAADGALPPGTTRYSFVSTTTSDGTCSRSMEAISTGPNTPPKVVTHVSGKCPKAAAAPSAALSAAPAPAAIRT
ncbi:MAG TPA: hypothetical protein VFW19_08100 [Allosphingosinicella sp.]|nr:hypothetical protein [Allosphingosinicella sp.]